MALRAPSSGVGICAWRASQMQLFFERGRIRPFVRHLAIRDDIASFERDALECEDSDELAATKANARRTWHRRRPPTWERGTSFGRRLEEAPSGQSGVTERAVLHTRIWVTDRRLDAAERVVGTSSLADHRRPPLRAR